MREVKEGELLELGGEREEVEKEATELKVSVSFSLRFLPRRALFALWNPLDTR